MRRDHRCGLRGRRTGSSIAGPDQWVTVKADPPNGAECLEGVSVGRFKAAAGSANLAPAL
jgi:hypothetical protein